MILFFFRKKSYDVGDEHSLNLVVKFEAKALIISCLNKAIMTGETGFKLVPLVLKELSYVLEFLGDATLSTYFLVIMISKCFETLTH